MDLKKLYSEASILLDIDRVSSIMWKYILQEVLLLLVQGTMILNLTF